jgi:ligand-binding SRPBCC domain-containing protein
MRFTRSIDIDAPPSVLWAFHERPEVLAELQPPWERSQVIKPPRSLAVGTQVMVKVWIGPIPITVEAEHVVYEPPHRFVDVMRRGPFRSWRHEHRCERRDDGGARLVDDIEYELPLGGLGIGKLIVARRLDRMFEYRHQVTKAWCESHR